MSYNKRPNPGQATMANSEPVVISSDQSAVPVSSATLATTAKQDTLLTELQLKADLTETQPVSAASLPLPAGAATSAAQATLLTELQLKADLTETQPVSLASVPSHAVTNAGTFAVQDSEKIADNGAFTDGATKVQPVGHIFDEVAGTALTENDIAASRIDSKRAQIGVIEDATTRGQRAAVSAAGALKVDNSAVTQPVSAASLPLPAGAATSALQTQPGIDIGDVTINNAAGASAVNIQDGGNSITVDGTVAVSGTVAVTDNAGSLTVDAPVGTPAFVRLSDGVAAIATLPVSLATLPALTASTANIGDVDVLTLPALPAGTNNIGDVDVLTVNGVAPAFGTGLRGATVQRVTVATDDLVPVSAASLPLPAGAATSALQTTQDTSINTLLKPASTLAAVTTVATVTNLSQLGGAAVSMNTGVRDAGTQRVTIATNDSVPVTGTITAVTAITNALPAGTNLIGKVGIDQTTPGTTNAVVVTANGVISTANSSAAALGISGVFTGTSEDATEYADIRVSVFSDQASATDGLQIQQSSNGTNWDIIDSYSIPASTGKNFSIGVSSKFFRIVYTNGGVAQTAFRLQAKLQKTYTKSSSVRPQDARTNDNDMEEQLGYNMVYNGTSWDRVRGTTANGIAVDVTRNAALVAGAAVIGKVGIDQTTPGTTNAVQDIPATSGGLSKFHLVSAVTNVNNVKASAGQVYAITAFNLNAAARYLKLHNTSGTPTIGTGVTDTYMIPGNTAGAGLVLNIDKGIAFSTGIGLSLTTGIADADTANVAASEIVLNIYYK